MNPPETRYARTPDGASIAYHTVGDGPVDLLWFHAFMGGLEVLWEFAGVRAIRERFASFGRLIPGSIPDAVRRFVGADSPAAPRTTEFRAVLFTDIVGSTEHLASVGDAAWRELILAHDERSKAAVERHGGRYVKSTGDGILATFEGPAQAVRAARELATSLRDLGIGIRAGVHVGEIERIGDHVTGVTVNVAARVSALAGTDEMLVSSTVKDLAPGSGLLFEDAGEHELKGVPDRWHLYRVGG